MEQWAVMIKLDAASVCLVSLDNCVIAVWTDGFWCLDRVVKVTALIICQQLYVMMKLNTAFTFLRACQCFVQKDFGKFEDLSCLMIMLCMNHP